MPRPPASMPFFALRNLPPSQVSALFWTASPCQKRVEVHAFPQNRRKLWPGPRCPSWVATPLRAALCCPGLNHARPSDPTLMGGESGFAENRGRTAFVLDVVAECCQELCGPRQPPPILSAILAAACKAMRDFQTVDTLPGSFYAHHGFCRPKQRRRVGNTNSLHGTG